MMLSDLFPVRKTLAVIRPVPRFAGVIHRIDSWWVFRDRVFGGKEREIAFESSDFHDWYCNRAA